MSTLAQILQKAIATEEPHLRAIPEEGAGPGSGGPGRWSRKQELGHLIDSATNNRVRIVTAALDGRYAGPTYDGDGWVEVGGYAGMPWNALIDLWKMLNLALAAAIERVPPQHLAAECSIGGASASTLKFVIEDYVLHMQHHLDRVLGRERPTAYPGTALGV